MGDHHAVRGAIGDGQRGRLLIADIGGHADQLAGGDQTFFGQTAVHHLAHQADLGVERIDQHAVADRPVVDAGADFQNFTGDIKTDDHRHRHFDTRHAAHREHIVIVKGGGANADDHVAFLDDGIRKIGHVFEIVDAAVLL